MGEQTEFTELTDLIVERVDAVAEAANGTGFILMKSADGGMFSKEDVEALLKAAVEEEQEDQEKDEEDDEDARGADAKKGAEDDELRSFISDLVKGAADVFEYRAEGTVVPEPEIAALITKRTFTAEERRRAAQAGHALPDGSYPIENAGDLHNAIHAIGRGSRHSHAEIHDHIVAQAKRLGLKNMLPKSWGQGDGSADMGGMHKSAIDTEAIQKMVSDAVAEVRKADGERIEALEAELAKVKATPVPGGPVMLGANPQPGAPKDDRAVKAARFRKMAEDPNISSDLRSYYRAWLRENDRGES
jgi:hypothetical protein